MQSLGRICSYPPFGISFLVRKTAPFNSMNLISQLYCYSYSLGVIHLFPPRWKKRAESKPILFYKRLCPGYDVTAVRRSVVIAKNGDRSTTRGHHRRANISSIFKTDICEKLAIINKGRPTPEEFPLNQQGAGRGQRFNVQDTSVPTGRRALHGDARAHYKKLHGDIINNILNQVQNRFKDHEKLSFLSLLDPQQFTSFKTAFPETAFSSLTDSYGTHFDLPRLKTELSVMYRMSDFQGRNPSDLVLFLQHKGLSDSMQQLYALACLVVTIPVTTASVERTFSALKRIKT